MSGQVKGLLWRTARHFVTKGLMQDANRIWADQPHEINRAIDKVEQAWSLTHDPRIAIQLVTMYDQANRSQDALAILREAFRHHPTDALVRHHAAITLLRHGAKAHIRDFFDSVLRIDPGDAFARFVVSMLDSYETWVAEVVGQLRSRQAGRRPFIISCPVWGQSFASKFVRYLCATLLAPNNMPRLAERYSVHFAIFTTAETESHLKADKQFARLAERASVHFLRYDESNVKYGPAMEACYGQQNVFYSNQPLSFYYARNCKFVLMSCAHYVALAAGRAADAFVSCLVADTILSNGALSLMAERLEGTSDAVLVNCLHLDGDAARARMDAFRRGDGAIEIAPQDCARLAVEHLPAFNFADAHDLPRIPLRVCWRVGPQGVLVHGNHYHPKGLRPKAFGHPLHLSIDPVDSRFIDRTSLTMDRIHLVRDSSIMALSIEDGPMPEQLTQAERPLSIDDAAFWLWGYWGRLRGALFRSPLRLGSASPEEWAAAEARAMAVVDAIVDRAADFEEGNWKRATWRLP